MALLRRLLRYQPGLYLLSAGSPSSSARLALAPAFIAREVFDTLAGRADPRIGLAGLAALLVLAELARVGTPRSGPPRSSITASLTAKALLRKNLLQALLARPDARGLTGLLRRDDQPLSRRRRFAEGLVSTAHNLRLGQVSSPPWRRSS